METKIVRIQNKPDFRNYFEDKPLKNGKAKKFDQIIGRWSAHEEIKYCGFLKNNMQLLNDPQKRKTKKVFERMASALHSRDAEQCRSHHQKMMARFQGILKIIEHLEGSYFFRTTREGEIKEKVQSAGTAESTP